LVDGLLLQDAASTARAAAAMMAAAGLAAFRFTCCSVVSFMRCSVRWGRGGLAG
jgi:hypothetical protein